MKPITAITLFGALALASAAEARMFLPREGRFLSADRAGMIDGPNLYQYARSNPARWRDPTGKFADVDPELPHFRDVLLAAIWINTDVALWALREPPCSIPNWPTIRSAITRKLLANDLTVRASGSIRSPSGAVVPAWTDGDLRTIYITPVAGHSTVTLNGVVAYDASGEMANIGTTWVNTPVSWIGLLGHELVHAAGFSWAALGRTASESLGRAVGAWFEQHAPKGHLPLVTDGPLVRQEP